MEKIFLTGIVLLLAMAQSFAADNTAAVWQKANELYKQKQYDSAAMCYEQVVTQAHSAEAYYNLGNTYYRLNKVGMAILNYERALRINPDYKDAKDNLLLTETRMTNRMQDVSDIFFVDWWNRLTAGSKQKTWALLTLITFIVIVGIMLFNMLQKTGRFRFPPQLAGVLGFVWLCLLVVAIASANNYSQSAEAVVMQNDAPLMNAEQKGKPLSLIPEGTTVRIKATRGEYVEVRLPDGRTGWLQLTLVNKI